MACSCDFHKKSEILAKFSNGKEDASSKTRRSTTQIKETNKMNHL
jgi:hypothetical protein